MAEDEFTKLFKYITDRFDNVDKQFDNLSNRINNLEKLIDNNLKVGICEQLEDPKTVKGIVKRDLVKIITPGTYISNIQTEKKESNFIMAIYDLTNSFYAVSFIVRYCNIAGVFFIQFVFYHSIIYY